MSAMVNSTVGFVAGFPQEYSDDGAPPGQELAEFISNHLKQSGFACSQPNERGGWAWQFVTKDTTVGSTQVVSIVGLVDDTEVQPPRQWLMTNTINSGFLSRLFGGSGAAAKREKLLRAVCEGIHKCMQADKRFSEVRWYNDETFNQPNDDPSPAP